MKIGGRNILFKNPSICDILIFDETNNHLIKNAVNPRYSTVIFNMRPEDIFVSLRVAVCFASRFFKHNIKEEVKHRKGSLFGLIRYARHVYLEACIITIEPKAVVTFIDNSGEFHWLSKNCRLFPFIAVQNGTRLSYVAGDPALSTYYLQHLFTYGEHEVAMFPELGYQVENFYPAGSLLASLNFNKYPPSPEKKYDLLIVSTWRGNIGFQKEVQDTMRSMKIMDILLARYTRECGIKTGIILRAEKDSQDWFIPQLGLNEADYYKEIYGADAAIIETDFIERNIFPLILQSQMVISCLSSAVYEAFGIGKKILFCNFTGTDIYHQDIDRSILCTNSNYEVFSAGLNRLLAMPQHEYIEQFKTLMKYYMRFPAGRTTYEAISDKIDDIITRSAPA